MSNVSPLFSIVLPTLNRASYLESAIKSVLNQSFKDFELIISNNSSTDNTEEIILSFDDNRIVYVKTDSQLPMDKHWEFALSKAKGEYVTFLGDDDAYSHIYLQSIAEIINKHDSEIVACRMADYYYEEIKQDYGFNINADSLLTYKFDNGLSIYDSPQIINNIFATANLINSPVSEEFQAPQLINTVYKRQLFSKLKDKYNNVFPHNLSGDYYLAIMTLNLTDKYYFLNSPLSFHGVSSASTTVSISKSNKKDKSSNNSSSIMQLNNAPLKTFTPINFVVDAILEAKFKLGSDLDYIQLEYTNYIRMLLGIIYNRELAGADVAAEKAEIKEFIALQDKEIRQELKSDVLNWKTVLKNFLRSKIYNTKIYDLLMKRHNAPVHPQLIIEGRENGFSNIEECGQVVGKEFLDKFAGK